MENIYFIIITSDYYHIFFLISNTGWIINSGLEIYGSCCLSFCFGSVFMCNEFSFCLSFFLFHSAAIWELWLFFQRGWLRFATQVLARLSNQIFRVEQRKVNKKSQVFLECIVLFEVGFVLVLIINTLLKFLYFEW